MTYGSVTSVVYAEQSKGTHGNFLPATYRRVVADPAWRSRLEKVYTASERVPRSGDRRRFELECCSSSDALLMNIFCYPRVTHRASLCDLLGVEIGQRPAFGVRAMLPMRRGEIDRTEVDMRLGDLLCEAKLTESGFPAASMERVLRYEGVNNVFDVDALPRSARGVVGYQLVRAVLAAQTTSCRFALIADGRRYDLHETWFRVLQAVRSYELRSRMLLLTWQEITKTLPETVQVFLAGKYGIEATR